MINSMTNGRKIGFQKDTGDRNSKWDYHYPAGTILKVQSQSGFGIGYLSEESTAEKVYLKPSIVYCPDFSDDGKDIPRYRLEEELPIIIEKIGPITYVPLTKEDLDRFLDIGKKYKTNRYEHETIPYSGRIIISETHIVRAWNPPELPLKKPRKK